MADVIRDVIIKIAIKQEDIKLHAPDITPITQFEKAATEGVDNVSDSFRSFEKNATSSIDGVGDEIEQLDKQIQGVRPSLEDMAAASTQAQQELTDNSLKMSEGFRTAGEGAFTLARGIAFVGAASEEDLQKAVQTIAEIQGAFDIFKGGIDVVKGLTEGTRALRAVTTTAATAELGLASANTAVATTGAAATVSMRGLLLTLGPIAIALAVVGAAFLFFKDAPDDIEDTTDALGRQNKALKDRATLEKSAQQFEGALQAKLVELEAREKILAVTKGQITEEKQLEFINARRAAKNQAAQDALDEARKRIAKLPLNEQRLRLSQAIAKTSQKAAEAGIEAENAKLDLSLERFKAEQDIKKAAEDSLKSEQDKLALAEQRFGSLSAEDAIEAKRAARIFKEKGIAGLDKDQAALIGRVGGERGQEIQKEFQQAQAKERGFGQLSEDLGLDDKLDQAEESLKNQAEKFEEFTEDNAKTNDEIVDVMSTAIDHLGNLRNLIASLADQLDKINN
jgi:hypothetical protein